MTTSILGENYSWWQQHGGGWPAEIERRRAYMPIYHLQEIILAEYFSRYAPQRILEFGCGFGRQLSYLSRIPGLEVYGCDQSPTMIDGIRAWASEEWIDERITLVEPLAPLPYPDKSFDIVFTVSVLIHVRPEHVQFILKELMRLARWQIIHIENNHVPDTVQMSEAHDGSWAHPIVQHYRALGQTVEVFEKPFEIEDVYRVVLDKTQPIYDFNPTALGKMLMLDRVVGEQINTLSRRIEQAYAEKDTVAAQLRTIWAEQAQLLVQLREARANTQDLSSQLGSVREENSQLRTEHEQDEAQLRQLWVENARLRSERQQLAKQVDEQATQLGQLEARCAQLEARLFELQEQQQQARQLEELEQLVAEYRQRLDRHTAFTAELSNLLGVKPT